MLQRILRRVDTASSDCWVWLGQKNNQGYGVITAWGTSRYVHRVMWQLLVGPIPDGLTIDHLCRVPLCCNPRHLEPVTQAENTRRAIEDADPAHPLVTGRCSAGHELTPDNTYHRKDRLGRQCRICKRDRMRKYAARRREQDREAA